MPITCLDKMDIQELICLYANSLDDGNLDNWLSCWADDGVWEGALGVYIGKASLAKLPADLGSRIENKRHIMTNFVITGDGDQANSTSYLLIIERETSTKTVATGVYTDSLRKLNGLWKFVHRKIQLDSLRTT